MARTPRARKRHTHGRLHVGAIGDAYTVEETLHAAQEELSLLQDLFELRAAAPDYLQAELLGAAASRAAAKLCREAGANLRDILESLAAETMPSRFARGSVGGAVMDPSPV